MQTATLAVVIGSALLALWVDQRFPKLVPDSLARTLVHALVAFVGLQIGASVATVTAEFAPLVRFGVLFGLMIPGFVYVFLAAIWIMRLLQSALRAYQ